MLTERLGKQLNSWIAAVAADDLPHLHRFVRDLDTDHAAVRNGLALPYSSGAVEEHVNRMKMLKRQMYGRAGLASSANEYSSATDTFRIEHGKWARTSFRPSFTYLITRNDVTWLRPIGTPATKTATGRDRLAAANEYADTTPIWHRYWRIICQKWALQ